MTQRSRVSALVWGVLSILAGGLMTEGGVMEVIAYWPPSPSSNIAVGALGAVGSAVLLVSGVAFLTRRSFGRQAAIVGAIGMASIHLLGWTLGSVGVLGVLVGVAYPSLLLLVLRRDPSLGAPSDGGARSSRVKPLPPSDGTMRRVTLHAA